MNKAVFFDRDDTLIEDKVYLNDPDQIHYLPGVFEALSRIQEAGFKIIVVTNQSGVAKGIVDTKNVHEIHRRISAEFQKHGVTINAFYYAPYSTTSNHYYRKPRTGMLQEGVTTFQLNSEECWMVGDRMTDIEAGHRMGMKSVLMNRSDGGPEASPFDPPEAEVDTITQVADYILGHS